MIVIWPVHTLRVHRIQNSISSHSSRLRNFVHTKMTNLSFPNETHSTKSLLDLFNKTIPSLDPSAHKGQNGRLAVLGGSPDYTGAPYFASTAILRAGADLVTVFCHPSAAVPLKTMSPELMVSGEHLRPSASARVRAGSWFRKVCRRCRASTMRYRCARCTQLGTGCA